MNAKRKIQSITCATMILASGGLSAFAQNSANSDSSDAIMTEKRPDMPPGKPRGNIQDEKFQFKPDCLKGTVRIEGEGEQKLFRFDSENRISYVINLVQFKRRAGLPEEDFSDKRCKNEKDKMLAKKKLNDKEPFGRKKTKKDLKCPEPVTIQTLNELNGKSVKLSGFLNEETNVFTVLGLER